MKVTIRQGGRDVNQFGPCPSPAAQPFFTLGYNKGGWRSAAHLVEALQQAHDPALDLLLLQGTTGAIHAHGLDPGDHGGDADGLGGGGDEGALRRGRAGGDGAGRAEESGAEHVGLWDEAVVLGCAKAEEVAEGAIGDRGDGGEEQGRLMMINFSRARIRWS